MLKRHGPSSTYVILFTGSTLLLKILSEYNKSCNIKHLHDQRVARHCNISDNATLYLI